MSIQNRDLDLFKRWNSRAALLNSPYLDYSRVEIAVAARRDGCSCGTSPQLRHNKADAVRSACPGGEFGRIFLGDIQGKWYENKVCRKIM